MGYFAARGLFVTPFAGGGGQPMAQLRRRLLSTVARGALVLQASAISGCGGPLRFTQTRARPLALGVVDQKSGGGVGACGAAPLGGSLYTWMAAEAPLGTLVDTVELRTPPPYDAVDAVAAVDAGIQDQTAPYAVRLGPSLKVNGALLAAVPPGALRLGVALVGSRFTEETLWLPLLFDPLVVFYRPDVLRGAHLSPPRTGWTFEDLLDDLIALRARRVTPAPLALLGSATALTAVVAGRRRGYVPWLPPHAFWVAAPDALLLAVADGYGVSLLPTKASMWASARFANACTLWTSLMGMAARTVPWKCVAPFAGWTAAFQIGFLSDASSIPKSGRLWAIAPAPAGPAGRVIPARMAGMCVLRQRSVAQALGAYERILAEEQAGTGGVTAAGLPLFPRVAASLLRKEFGLSDGDAKTIGDVRSCVRVNTEFVSQGQSGPGHRFPAREGMAYAAGVGSIAMVAASARTRKELEDGLLLAARATRNAMVGAARTHVHCTPAGSCYRM